MQKLENGQMAGKCEDVRWALGRPDRVQPLEHVYLAFLDGTHPRCITPRGVGVLLVEEPQRASRRRDLPNQPSCPIWDQAQARKNSIGRVRVMRTAPSQIDCVFVDILQTFENMAEVKLWCGVYGAAASVFPVTVARDAKVSALRKAIFHQFDQQPTFPASALKLYVAREDNGVWLKADDTLGTLLRGEIDRRYAELPPSRTLDDEACLGPAFEPCGEEIQVLVALPDAPVRVAGVSAAKLKQLFHEVLDERAKKKRKRAAYSFSELTDELGKRMLDKMGLQQDCFDFEEPNDTSIAGYQWLPGVAEDHEDQRAGYMAYLQLHLKPLLDQKGFQLEDISQEESLLSIVDPRLPFRMDGTADVLLVNRLAKNPANKLAGVRMVIELKRRVEPSHVPQALGQLASCSLKAPLHCYPGLAASARWPKSRSSTPRTRWISSWRRWPNGKVRFPFAFPSSIGRSRGSGWTNSSPHQATRRMR